MKLQSTTGIYRSIRRWAHEEELEAVTSRLNLRPDIMRTCRQTVEHPFGTLEAWMGATYFLTKGFINVGTEMSLHVLAYNMKRVMNILGSKGFIQAMRA